MAIDFSTKILMQVSLSGECVVDSGTITKRLKNEASDHATCAPFTLNPLADLQQAVQNHNARILGMFVKRKRVVRHLDP
tara:strand:+ start:50 stop:286 length:237 start_codon:yes stop_codon:yes gene_type:complete